MKWYWTQKQQHNIIAVMKFTIVHLCIDFFLVEYFQYVTISVCNRKQAQQALQIHTICITDSNNEYIIDENLCQDQIEYGRNINI